jgi:hypothetical protein
MVQTLKGQVVIVDPSGHLWREPTSLAKRVDSFEGKTVGLLDDGVAGSHILLERIGELLQERNGVGRVVLVRKPNLSARVPKAMYEDLKAQVDFMVVGVGA